MGNRAAVQTWFPGLRRILGVGLLVVALAGLALSAAPRAGAEGDSTRHLGALHLATSQSPAYGHVPCNPALSCVVVVMPSPASQSLHSRGSRQNGLPPRLQLPSGADAAPQTPPPRHAV